MNPSFVKIICLVLLLPNSQMCTLFAQNADWFIAPRMLQFDAAGASVSTMPGAYPAPYHTSNATRDAAGNLMFTVVDEFIYDAAGTQIGTLASSWHEMGKDIAIIPDPGDCEARIILYATVDLIVGPGSYEWTIRATRVSRNAGVWTVQNNYYTLVIGGCDNAFMAMAVRKPDTSNRRFWYVILSRGIYVFHINASLIMPWANTQLNGDEKPTDADISPSADRLIWTDYEHELRWYNMNILGDLTTYGSRPITTTGAYYSSGVEFVDNNRVWVSAVKDDNSSGGIYQCTFGNPVASVVNSDKTLGNSQLEKALDGRIYAASATQLWGKHPVSASVNSIPGSVFSDDAWGIIPYYSLPEQLDDENNALVFSCGCLPYATITGTFSTPLTETQTWIASSGVCEIAAGSTVKLDADPTNGYVLLQPGFKADASLNLTFVAQAFNGCVPGAPLRPDIEPRDESAINASEGLPPLGGIRFFPNPVKEDGMLEFERPVEKETRVWILDMAGRTLRQFILPTGGQQLQISLQSIPAGLYIVRAQNESDAWSIKVVKE